MCSTLHIEIVYFKLMNYACVSTIQHLNIKNNNFSIKYNKQTIICILTDLGNVGDGEKSSGRGETT